MRSRHPLHTRLHPTSISVLDSFARASSRSQYYLLTGCGCEGTNRANRVRHVQPSRVFKNSLRTYRRASIALASPARRSEQLVGLRARRLNSAAIFSFGVFKGTSLVRYCRLNWSTPERPALQPVPRCGFGEWRAPQGSVGKRLRVLFTRQQAYSL